MKNNSKPTKIKAMMTILIIASFYVISIACIGYEMKNAIEMPDDFEECQKQPSAASEANEVDEGFWSNTATAI